MSKSKVKLAFDALQEIESCVLAEGLHAPEIYRARVSNVVQIYCALISKENRYSVGDAGIFPG